MFNPKNSAWLLLALATGGCAAQNRSAQKGGAGETRDALRGVAASFVMARAFDRAQLALQRGDNAGLEGAAARMRGVADTNPVLVRGLINGWSNQAGQLYERSLFFSGQESYRLQENSNAQYRAALAAAPADATAILDAQTLNALGYFLADRGSTREDYQQAAILTRAAFKKWDISGKTPADTPQQRALGAQDSYAWALFRLGRFEEARAQQVQVWKIARALGADKLSGDIAFHMGEIYRVLGEDKKARAAYQTALQGVLTPATRTLVEGGLQLLELSKV